MLRSLRSEQTLQPDHKFTDVQERTLWEVRPGVPVGRGCSMAMLHLKSPTEIAMSLPQFTLRKFIFTPA